MTKLKHKAIIFISFLVLSVGLASPSAEVSAGKICGAGPGSGLTPVTTSIDLGCRNTGNPIMDATFAIIRFLSVGVGLVIVGSMVYAGIQYSASKGDPQAASQAKGRIRANVIALLIFIFGYAILNYLIPGGFLHP